MNRTRFQQLARLRLREHRALMKQGMPSGAYYLCGYTVECALKACIAKMTRRHAFPPGQRMIQKIYSHDLQDLLIASGLDQKHKSKMKSSKQFARYWAVVRDWSEEVRYDTHSEQKASDLYKAITARDDGVLKWIKHYW